jgi:hypothetical protein
MCWSPSEVTRDAGSVAWVEVVGRDGLGRVSCRTSDDGCGDNNMTAHYLLKEDVPKSLTTISP